MSNEPNPNFHEFQFIKTYDQYADKIFRYLYFRIHDRERAMELMQETFMKTFLYLQKKESIIENMQAFLYRVANNLIIDDVKKRKTYSLEQMEEEHGFTPSVDKTDQLKAKIDADKILELVGQISPTYQSVIIMRYVDELTPKEIAEILNQTENAISVKIHRGIDQLRKLLEQYE